MTTLKKKVKPGLIELDPNEPTIVVHYVTMVVDSAKLDANGEPEVVMTKDGDKRIKLSTFHANSNAEKFAQQILESCKYIHESKGPFVMSLLEQLRQRIISQSSVPQQHQQQPMQVHNEQYEAAPQQQQQQQRYTPQQQQSQGQPPMQKQQQPQQSSRQQPLVQPQPQPQQNKAYAPAPTHLSQQVPPREEAVADLEDDGLQRALPEGKYAESKSLAHPVHDKPHGVSSAQQQQQQVVSNLPPPMRWTFQEHNNAQPQGLAGGKRALDRPGRRKTKTANIKKLDSYAEMLYEENMEEKINGTAMILQLAQDPANLEVFLEQETIIGALARVLIEDRKRNTDLVTNILEIFFCFSNYSQLHSVLSQNKIGDTTMRVIELEFQRYEMWIKENQAKPDQDKLQRNLRKQEHLLYVCFYILLNLAEDPNIEIKMTSRDINKQLLRMLEREQPGDADFFNELQLLVVTFLKKLSIFGENKEEMVQEDVLTRILPLFQRQHESLRLTTLRLLFNLSFDPHMREELVSRNLVPMLFDATADPHARPYAVKILYNVAAHSKLRNLLKSGAPDAQQVATVFEEGTLMLTELICTSEGRTVDKELVALAINLVTVDRLAEAVCCAHPPLFQALMKRVHATLDPLLMKMVRNISDHDNCRPSFAKYLHELAGMILKAQNPDFMLEALATLANIALPDMLYSELVTKHGLLEYIMKYLVPGFAEDDILLEVVMVVGTIAMDEKTASLLAQSRLVRMLHDLLHEKHGDEDIVLQVLFTIFKLLLHEDSRKVVLRHDVIGETLLDLVVDPCPEIRRFAHMCLDIIMDFDEDWRNRICDKRFEACNAEWLKFIENGAASLQEAAGLQPHGALRHAHEHDNEYDDEENDTMKTSNTEQGQEDDDASPTAAALYQQRHGHGQERIRSQTPGRQLGRHTQEDEDDDDEHYEESDGDVDADAPYAASPRYAALAAGRNQAVRVSQGAATRT